MAKTWGDLAIALFRKNNCLFGFIQLHQVQGTQFCQDLFAFPELQGERKYS